MMQVAPVQPKRGDCGVIDLGKSLSPFTEGRPARLDVAGACGQHRVELCARQRLARTGRRVLARKRVERKLEFEMHQLRPGALKPGEQLLERRPARVARSHLMRRTAEPGGELAAQRSIDLAQPLYPRPPPPTAPHKPPPLTTHRTKAPSPH